MDLTSDSKASQKGKEDLKISERQMLCGCASEKPKIEINLEQDTKWWKNLNLSILLLLISSVLKHQY